MVPVFYYSLLKYLMQELERVQIAKRAISIICLGHSYHEALDIMNLKELATHMTKYVRHFLTQM